MACDSLKLLVIFANGLKPPSFSSSVSSLTISSPASSAATEFTTVTGEPVSSNAGIFTPFIRSTTEGKPVPSSTFIGTSCSYSSTGALFSSPKNVKAGGVLMSSPPNTNSTPPGNELRKLTLIIPAAAGDAIGRADAVKPDINSGTSLVTFCASMAAAATSSLSPDETIIFSNWQSPNINVSPSLIAPAALTPGRALPTISSPNSWATCAFNVLVFAAVSTTKSSDMPVTLRSR
mmetsp:Transcript_24848/g.38416  ORF Transcript_24848/g.38416 Transcript_24848/m.38416 type:complete len:234 (-) Transcript_24848:732-1433(-)